MRPPWCTQSNSDIGSLRTAKFIRYIQGDFRCSVLWGPKIFSDITESDIYKFYLGVRQDQDMEGLKSFISHQAL